MWDELKALCDTLEESYEFALAYAAQGLSGDENAASTDQMREFLQRTDAALASLPDLLASIVERDRVEPNAPYRAFIDVLGRDARAAQAGIRLVLAQPVVSSQLVDNLNASIHLRALLTDVFLIDEILKLRRASLKTRPTTPT